MPITGEKFLITGGASLIGSHLTRALLDAGAAEVVLYDNLSLGSAALLGAFGPDRRVRSIRGDVLRLPPLLDAAAGVSGVFALGDEAHDYLYAGDAASACVRAMDSAGASGAFNIASGRSTSVNDIVTMVLAEYGSTLEPEHVVDTRAVRSTAHHELRISTARAKETIGWEPTVSLQEGITRVRQWLDEPDG